MASGYVIRAARTEDAPAIRDAHVAAIRGVAGGAYSPEQSTAWSAGKAAENYVRAMEREGETIIVAEAPTATGAPVVGFASLAGDEVRAVYVHPDHAGRGLGGRLLGAAEQIARERGSAKLRLTASLNAVPFYRAHGYEEVCPTTFELVGGIKLPCLCMSKVL
jgi:putative acetyltransferase